MTTASDTAGGTRTTRPAAAVLEQLAAAVMSTEASDAGAVARLAALFEDLFATGHPAMGAAAELAGSIRAAQGTDLAALASVLDRASEAVAHMQDAFARCPEVPPAPTSRRLVLPEWGDEGTLQEFVAAQRGALEDLEHAILAMENGDPEHRAAFERRLHTLKGEASVLGLQDLERACHEAEDYLEGREISSEVTDRLLRLRDWLARALDAYARMERPEPGAQPLAAAATTGEPAPPPASPRAPPPTSTPAAPSAPATAPCAASPTGTVHRDAETVGLFGEFLTESAEGLNRVDQILMNAERDGTDRDTVNGLFRVFHTIKGTAGFLELEEVVALAHDTEAMLNRCRENALELRGSVVDAVFDATAALREMLDGVRAAVEGGTPIPHRDGLGELLARVRDVTEGRAVAERELPHAAPGEKLGDIVTHPPLSVAPEVVEAALERQSTSGRRLGEELVASGAVAPAQVAQALRSQARVTQEQAGSVKLKETIKVDVERVDSLVEMIGELVVVESMVVNAPEITQTTSVRVRNCLAQLAKVTRDLQDVGMHMRMVPVAGVFQKMARLVRDLSRKSGKQVHLVTSGEGTEVDRSVVEQIADPLVHMIRNAVDHGLEPGGERVAAGKSQVGQIRLSAYHEGGSVVVEIADDGRGLDRDRIVAKATERGLITTAEGMSEAEIYALIFAPGFSTAAQVTEISGRGVGMDVVKRNVEAMRGRVVISSTPGTGTKFKIVLPLTLAIIDGMLVACGEERYIIPTLSIVESLQPDAGMLVSLARTHEMINLRGEILPLLRLDRLFGVSSAKADPTEALVVVLEGVGRRLGLLVDEVVTQQQVVIKSLGDGLGPTRFVSGAAILSDGRVGLILNVEEIAGLLQGTRGLQARAAPAAAEPPSPTPVEEEIRA